MTGNNLLMVILGPTAIGKTELAVALARSVGGEIVSADSRQIYRYMDIGTAKPTLEQQQQIPHHLIDIVDPDDNLSLAQYQQMAYKTIDAIHQRGSIPLLVGGTGLYITATIEGWIIPEVPPNDVLRAELETFAEGHGSETLHQRLQELDPIAARTIDHRNIRRVIRALEVCFETNKPFSSFQRKCPPAYTVIAHGLTTDRGKLYQRADKRIDNMIDCGFVDEVRALLDQGYRADLPSMSGLGYRQIASYLMGEISLEEAINASKMATHHYIRRQYTWFRNHNNEILWHNTEEMELATLIETIKIRLQESG